MNNSLRVAAVAAVCGALLLGACAKKSDQTTTTTATDVSATGAPGAAGASGTAAPDVSAEASSGSNGSAAGYIALPVYPGATESKDNAMSVSAGDGSVELKVYTTNDDAKTVAAWYKVHLPAEFKGGILTSGDKTVGTFSDEHSDGDQTVLVANDAASNTTRIQLTTKHGK